MNKDDFLMFKAHLREEDAWFEENEGKFAAFSSDGDLLGTEADLLLLVKDMLERYSVITPGLVVFFKVEEGSLVRVSNIDNSSSNIVH